MKKMMQRATAAMLTLCGCTVLTGCTSLTESFTNNLIAEDRYRMILDGLQVAYVRGTDSECGNLTVTVSGVTPTGVTMGGKLASTAYQLQGQTITFSGEALEKLGDYGTITIETTGSGKPSVSVASDARIVYNTPI